MPPMMYINPMLQVEWMVIQLMEHRVVTHLSVCVVRVMASDVEHNTCGTFSSPSECVASSTSVFIDSVAHASCDACHSMVMTPVTAFIGAVVRESCDAMPSRPQERLKRREG